MSSLSTLALKRIYMSFSPDTVTATSTSEMKNFIVIVAATASTFGIGRLGDLPWKLVGDMAAFKKLTSTSRIPSKRNAVIMGRKTWDSLPKKFRPLPGRLNVVLSRNPNLRAELSIPRDVIVASNLEEALLTLGSPDVDSTVDQVFVIGGEAVYREAVMSKRCQRIRLTSVESEVADCDTFFPQLSASEFRMISRSAPIVEGEITYRFTELERISDDVVFDERAVGTISANQEEMQYLQLIEDIIKNGIVKGDRTGNSNRSSRISVLCVK